MMDEPNLELTTPDFFGVVRRYFGFLRDNYHCDVVDEEVNLQHSSRTMIFRKGDLRIDIWHEYSSVGVFLSIYKNDQLTGFHIGDVVTFINREEGKPIPEFGRGYFGPEIDQALAYRAKVLVGLSWYAVLLKHYMDRILLLFAPQTFEKREPELLEWKRLWEVQIRKAIKKEIYGKP